MYNVSEILFHMIFKIWSQMDYCCAVTAFVLMLQYRTCQFTLVAVAEEVEVVACVETLVVSVEMRVALKVNLVAVTVRLVWAKEVVHYWCCLPTATLLVPVMKYSLDFPFRSLPSSHQRPSTIKHWTFLLQTMSFHLHEEKSLSKLSQLPES